MKVLKSSQFQMMKNEITLKQLKKSTQKLILKINNLDEKQLTFLWFEEFYDGQLNGVLKYEDKEYRYEIVSDYKQLIYPRIFAIVPLTEEELEEEKYWNNLYTKLIKDQPGNDESKANFFNQQKKRKKIDYSGKAVLWYYIQN